MKIYVLALAIIIFSGVVTIFNELDVFNQKIYEPGYTVNQSQSDGIYEIDQTSETITTKEGISDSIADLLGFEWVMKAMDVVWKTFGLAINIGGLIPEYSPGEVQEKFGTLITGVTYFVYAWGGIQLWRKVSTKQMD